MKFQAGTDLKRLPRKYFLFEHTSTEICAQAPDHTLLEGLCVALAGILAYPPVFDSSHQHQAPPNVRQEQALLLAIVFACHSILVETKRLLRANKKVTTQQSHCKLTLTRLLPQPAARGLTYDLHPSNATCSLFSRRRCKSQSHDKHRCTICCRRRHHILTLMPALSFSHARR